MRLTRQTLLRIAKETAQKAALSDRGLIAAYLTGSLLTDSPFLGGTADIDLVFVHAELPPVRREIVAVTHEVHLDICHKPRSAYDKPKELRVHPWLGPELYDPLPLHVSQHFFEFVQAGVREKYYDPSNVLARARWFDESARQTWAELGHEPTFDPGWLLAYLNGVNLAANAVALLNGGPLPERRFLLQFTERSTAFSRPGLASGLLGLFGGGRVEAASLGGFLPEWEKDFIDAAGRPGVDVRIALPRLGYYKLGIEALLPGDTPLAGLWPLLLTWTVSAGVLPPTRLSRWEAACERLGLTAGKTPERLEALDAFLDNVEEMLEEFADRNNL